MSQNPFPENEQQRIAKLRYYNILDTEPEAAFDELTELASSLLDVPIIAVSLIDEKRQWFKSQVGLQACESPREISFCQHTIMGKEIFEVTDALKEETFKCNPLVTGEPHIRFYAGAPLIDEEGLAVGTLCAIDQKPRQFSDKEKEIFNSLARTIIRLIQYRKHKEIAEKNARVKEEFLSNMSHEIRTPLNAMIGFTDLLSKTPMNPQQQKYLETVQLSSQNLLVLVNDILDFSKLESGKLTLEKHPVHLQQLARHIITLKGPEAKAKNIKLLLNLDQELPDYILADKTRLSQMLVNLVSNAIKFTHEGSVELKIMELSRSKDKSQLHFSVKDTGIGIEESKQALIFERFTQAEQSTTRKYGGTGLGLSIVKMLLELYGSRLELESTEGQGSEFSFTLTLPLTSAAEQEQQSDKSVEQDNLLEGLNILVADDNKMNLALCRIYLERQGARVSLAENGKAAIEAVGNRAFDLVLMDMEMPEMDGLQATRFIREELGLKLPVIACSAHSLAGEKAKCLANGMDAYISKPYQEAELIYTVRDMIQGAYNCSLSKQQVSDKEEDFNTLLAQLEEKEGGEFMDTLLPLFLDKMPEMTETLREAYQKKDTEKIRQLSHSVAGTFSSLHYKPGYELARVVEQSADYKNWPLTDATCRKLIDLLEETLQAAEEFAA